MEAILLIFKAISDRPAVRSTSSIPEQTRKARARRESAHRFRVAFERYSRRDGSCSGDFCSLYLHTHLLDSHPEDVNFLSINLELSLVDSLFESFISISACQGHGTHGSPE
jgi:hypothetical protein